MNTHITGKSPNDQEYVLARRLIASEMESEGRRPVAVAGRMEQLKQVAHEDGFQWAAESEQGIHEFLRLTIPTRSPMMALLDNGNFRLLWLDRTGRQIGVQCLTRHRGLYALFGRNRPDTSITRSTGQNSFADIHMRIIRLGLGDLLYGER